MGAILIQNTQEVRQDRNLEAATVAEATEGAAHWLAPQGLLSLLSGPSPQGWPHPPWAVPPRQPLIKKMP